MNNDKRTAQNRIKGNGKVRHEDSGRFASWVVPGHAQVLYSLVPPPWGYVA